MIAAYPHLLGVFLDEARDQMEKLDVALAMLARDADDAGAWDAACRAAHTLKGNAGAMEFSEMHDVALAAELAASATAKGRGRHTLAVLRVTRDTLRRQVAAVGREAAGGPQAGAA
jgi:chemotaxis protein histidine kinase CheA